MPADTPAAAAQERARPATADSPAAHLAVFDVDRTLLLGDCLLMLGRHRQGGPLAWLLRWLGFLPSLLAKISGRISTGQLKERFLAHFILGRGSRGERANQAHDDLEHELRGPFLAQLQRRLRPAAVQRLRWHQQQGHRVILCSASPEFILQPLADALGVGLIGTQVSRRDDVLLPLLAGPNCKGPEKPRRLEALLAAEGQSLDAFLLEAYGDSAGDRELLQRAQLPHFRSFCADPRPYPPVRLEALLPVVALAMLAYGVLGFWSQGNQLGALLLRLWPTILEGMGLVLLGFGLRFLRWRLLLGATGQRPPLLIDARAWMGSFAFTATPGKTGETVRSLLLKQDCGTPIVASLTALMVERLTDGTSVLLLLLVNLPLLLHRHLPLSLPLIGGGLLLLPLLALTLLGQGRPEFRQRWLAKFRRRLPRSLAAASGDGIASLRQLLRPWLLLQASLIGALAWSTEGISLTLLLRAMGLEGVDLGVGIVAHTCAGLLGAISMLPGGLGSTEAGTVGMLSLLGVPLAVATPATLLIRLITLWFATALGVLCLLLPLPGRAGKQP
jgi:HAD superfamily hydrolase (TIGR01490 family)